MYCTPNWRHRPHYPSARNVACISCEQITRFSCVTTQYSPVWAQFPPFVSCLPKQQTHSLLFYILMWWELKGFDISISINCAGNIQRRAVWRHKNRITDTGVWNYKEIMHEGDIKKAFSDPSQRTWYNELRKSSRRCCAFCMSASDCTFIIGLLHDGRLMLLEVRESESTIKEKITCVWHTFWHCNVTTVQRLIQDVYRYWTHFMLFKTHLLFLTTFKTKTFSYLNTAGKYWGM